MSRSSRTGFTLVEMLMAMVVTAMIGTALIALLLGQTRFYRKNDDLLHAQQSVRAAIDLMASELRMGSPTDLIAASADSVSLRFDLLRAIVCDSTAADEATLFILDSVSNANLRGGVSGSAVSGPFDSTFVYADGWTGTLSSTGGAAKSTCINLGSPTSLPDAAYRRITGWSGNFHGVGVPNRGTLVRVYGRLTYRFAPSGFGAGIGLWRGRQELVSPFEAGAAFGFVMKGGSVQAKVSTGNLRNVLGIRISATASGSDANRYNVARTVDYDIPLRN